jgi:hypothetical protein
MPQSPDKPWTPGKHPTYTAFRLQVNVCQDGDGNVWSDHDFASLADEQVAQGLPQGSIPQVAHALLTEAVRREAFLCALLELGNSPDLLEDTEKAQPDIERYTTHVITKALEKMVPGAVAEVLAMMKAQVEGSPPPSKG